jgi:hypothetical protein
MMVCGSVSGKVVASTAPVFGRGMCIQIHPRIIVDDSCVISEGEILDFDKGDNQLKALNLFRHSGIIRADRCRSISCR